MAEELDDVRADLARTTELAKVLFEQQFIRCGGRMPADPSWDEIGEDERDEWWERAVDARPLIDSLLWLHAEAVWLGDQGQAAMRRALNGANQRVDELVVEKERERASRQAWAEEAMRLELADEARSCTGAGDCRSEVHHEGCLHGDPDASWYCIYPRERVHDPSRDAPALPEADRCTHPECKPTIRAVPWTDDDAELLAVAEARAAADTGERHSLDDVAAEFGVDLGSVLPEGEAP